ncbi:hypothetical protein L484_018639 [Morus notabilis]|uniref:Uncharacterized protein n=1 Tax=Morus notabilis TaxID=981085 RepID=W9RVU6_9ROSA|nr:hypothetical protein L484_018639 [Morus notabilis]
MKFNLESVFISRETQLKTFANLFLSLPVNYIATTHHPKISFSLSLSRRCHRNSLSLSPALSILTPPPPFSLRLSLRLSPSYALSHRGVHQTVKRPPAATADVAEPTATASVFILAVSEEASKRRRSYKYPHENPRRDIEKHRKIM